MISGNVVAADDRGRTGRERRLVGKLKRRARTGAHVGRAAADARAQDAGNNRDLLEQAFDHCGPVRGPVTGLGRVDPKGQHMAWIEARIDILEPCKTLDQQAGASQQDQREGDLGHDQCREHAAAEHPGRAGGAFLQVPAEVGAR